MLFNSLTYLLFFPIICIIYWCIPSRYRNAILLIASYYFYMSWEPAYTILIIITSLSTWGCAMLIDKNEKQKKMIIALCIIINLSRVSMWYHLLSILDANSVPRYFTIICPANR